MPHERQSLAFKPLKKKNLVLATYESMMKAIEIVKSGLPLGNIGDAIQTHVEKKGFFFRLFLKLSLAIFQNQ